MMLEEILNHFVENPSLHAKWLNTLSYMENAGAKKISASEDKELVSLLILKHAAEEHRHAYYLKKQISKLGENLCPTYQNQYLISSKDSKYYLDILDIKVSKYLKEALNLHGKDLKFAAYLLVTYAIEVRADDLYPIYQQVLDKKKSKVNVKSIILEEEGHLEEMISQLKMFSDDWQKHADFAIAIETQLFKNWEIALSKDISFVKM